MASSKLSYPLGSPAAGWDAAYISHLKAILTPDENDFSPLNVSAKFNVNATATAEDKKVVAIWDGEYEIIGGMVISTAVPDIYIRFLRDTYSESLPVPKKIIYGPIDTADGKLTCKSGDVIGSLTGNEFNLYFREKHEYYLNAYTYLELLRSKDLFVLDSSFDFPFSRNNISGVSELALEPATPGGSYYSIGGGSMSNVIYNPGTSIPDDLFSFLSNDTIDIAVYTAQPVSIDIDDITDAMYVARPNTNFSSNGSNLSFVPQTDLKPFHKSYNNDLVNTANNNGKREEGAPLSYQIRIFIGGTLTFETKIIQDRKDIIRQEYLFHSVPFQDRAVNNLIKQDLLEIPGRSTVQVNSSQSAFFKPDVFYDHNNYHDYLLNPGAIVKIAEWMRRNYVDQLLAIYENNTFVVPDEISTYDLKINSSWRNPERNEKVGGVQKSNHQFGRAVDLASKHAKTLANNPKNVAVHYALFQSGKVWLSEMIDLNGARNCRSLEVLLERKNVKILSYICDNAGVITMEKPATYNTIVTNPPVNDSEFALISRAGEYASHIHIGWNAPDGIELKFPAAPPYDGVNIIYTLPFKNVILVATEGADVAAADQLPLHHVAATIKAYLDTMPDAVETLVMEVSNPIEYLEAIGAFNPLYRIRYFFSMSHAYPYGITLNHVVNLATDAPLEERIRNVYGTKTNFGRDDFTEFRTNQFRVSNIRLLPEEMIRNLRAVFKKAYGIYILGCNAGNPHNATDNTFCQELANALGQPVYGAGYYSKVFEYDDGWDPVTINRTDPIDPSKKYVLAPNERGTFQYLNYIKTWHGLPENLHPSEAVDLLKFYQESLELAFPDFNFDKSWIETVEDLQFLDTD